MSDLQVKCTQKNGYTNESITAIGGDWGRYTKEMAIAYIDGGLHSFYTLSGLYRANVAVVNGPYGRYLQTHADGVWNNNLVALPHCVG